MVLNSTGRHGLSSFVPYKAWTYLSRHALNSKQTSIHHCAKLFRKKGTKSKGINIYKSMKPIRVPMRGPGKLTAESTNRSNEVELEDREYPSDCQRSEKARYLIVGLK